MNDTDTTTNTTHRCGGATASGGTCRTRVANDGDRCRHHAVAPADGAAPAPLSIRPAGRYAVSGSLLPADDADRGAAVDAGLIPAAWALANANRSRMRTVVGTVLYRDAERRDGTDYVGLVIDPGVGPLIRVRVGAGRAADIPDGAIVHVRAEPVDAVRPDDTAAVVVETRGARSLRIRRDTDPGPGIH